MNALWARPRVRVRAFMCVHECKYVPVRLHVRTRPIACTYPSDSMYVPVRHCVRVHLLARTRMPMSVSVHACVRAIVRVRAVEVAHVNDRARMHLCVRVRARVGLLARVRMRAWARA
eukprot:5856044-Pleurochrysis_carterae.AAC.1